MQRIAEQVQQLVTTFFFKTTHLWTTFSVRSREENSWSRQLWVAWNSVENWQSTMSTLPVVHQGWIFKYVHAEDNWTCRKKCSPALDKHLSNSLQMPAWHSKEREEPGMVYSRGRSIMSLPKIHKKGIYTSILDRFKNDEVFHASELQHKWTKEWCEIWIASEQLIFRTKLLQNNWNGALRCIIFGATRIKWKEDQ